MLSFGLLLTVREFTHKVSMQTLLFVRGVAKDKDMNEIDVSSILQLYLRQEGLPNNS